jgi:hypothetical protein
MEPPECGGVQVLVHVHVFNECGRAVCEMLRRIEVLVLRGSLYSQAGVSGPRIREHSVTDGFSVVKPQGERFTALREWMAFLVDSEMKQTAKTPEFLWGGNVMTFSEDHSDVGCRETGRESSFRM